MQAIIETLTPLHVGTGVEWQPKFEYLYFKEAGVVAILDPEKVLRILGEDNLHQWISCIEQQESLLSLLKRRKPDLAPEDIAALLIRSSGTLDKAVKSLIRSEAMGAPLLPGSSLKGAIRTAVFAYLLLNNHKLAKRQENLGRKTRRGIQWNDDTLEKKFFGTNPNKDIFRIFRPSDAHFSVQTQTCIVKSVNKYGDEFRIKESLTQIVEAIPPGATASLRILIDKLVLELKKGRNLFNDNIKIVSDGKKLFSTVNQHTLRLVEDEIEYWVESADNPECIGSYVDEMIEIRNEIKSCSETECVLRVGWGSGFRFMTGDWHGEMNDSDYDLLVKSLRPRHPVDLIFPKTMRIVDGGTPLGFVKLSLNNE